MFQPLNAPAATFARGSEPTQRTEQHARATLFLVVTAARIDRTQDARGAVSRVGATNPLEREGASKGRAMSWAGTRVGGATASPVVYAPMPPLDVEFEGDLPRTSGKLRERL